MGREMQRSRTAVARADPVKAHGVHYTPVELARFLAKHVLQRVPIDGPLSVLDPACGDGSLLAAIAAEVGEQRVREVALVGIDRDPKAISEAAVRLSACRVTNVELAAADFLASAPHGQGNQPWLLADGLPSAPQSERRFDVVISNPPYVRTQVLRGGDSS